MPFRTWVILTLLSLEIVFNETNYNDFGSTFQISNDSKITLYPKQNQTKIVDLPTQDEELVKWATQKFGGVTSFTTIQSPKEIHLTGTGENYWCNLANILRTQF